MKFWNKNQQTLLYNAFDIVRLYNYAKLDAVFIGDMMDQKITKKALRRIEAEWDSYTNDIFESGKGDKNKLHVFYVNRNQIMLMKVRIVKKEAKAISKKFPEMHLYQLAAMEFISKEGQKRVYIEVHEIDSDSSRENSEGIEEIKRLCRYQINSSRGGSSTDKNISEALSGENFIIIDIAVKNLNEANTKKRKMFEEYEKKGYKIAGALI